jgi:hypothetical protein
LIRCELLAKAFKLVGPAGHAWILLADDSREPENQGGQIRTTCTGVSESLQRKGQGFHRELAISVVGIEINNP